MPRYHGSAYYAPHDWHRYHQQRHPQSDPLQISLKMVRNSTTTVRLINFVVVAITARL